MPALTKKSTSVIVVVLAALLVVAGAWAGPHLIRGTPLVAAAAIKPFVLKRGMQAPFADSGPAGDVKKVRVSVVAALTSEDTASAVDADHRAALTHAQRVALLARNHTAARAAELASAVEFSLGQKPFVESGTFVVEKWQGVLVGGQTAKAYVTGHDEIQQVDGTPWRDASYQARVLLIRSPSAPHGWLVSKIISTPLET